MNQPPHNLLPERDSLAPTQTETDYPTIVDGAVRKDEVTLD